MRIISLRMLVAVAAVVSFGIAKRSDSKKKRSANKPKEHKLVIDHRNLLSAIVTEQASLVEVFVEFCSWVRKWIPLNRVADFTANVFLTNKFCPVEHIAISHQDWLTAIGLTTEEIRKSVDETHIFSQLARVSENLLDAVKETRILIEDITQELPTIRVIRSKVDWMKVACTKFLNEFDRHRSIWVTMSSKVEDLDSAITDYYERVLERFEIRHMSAEDRAITSTTRLPPSSATSLEDSDAKNEFIPTKIPETVEGTTKKLTWAEMEDTDDEDEEVYKKSMPTERPETVEGTTKRISWADMVDSADEDEYDEDEEGQINVENSAAEKVKGVLEQERTTTTTIERMAGRKVVNSRKNRKNNRKY